jgi:chemotaxis protein MotB
MSAVSRRRGGFDVWPGFVDALTSLIMVMVFLLLIFAVGQAVLSDTLSVKTRALEAVNARVAELARALSLSEEGLRAQQARADELAAALRQTVDERDRLEASAEGAAGRESGLSAEVAALNELKRQLEAEVARLLAETDTTKQDLLQQTEANVASAAQIELLNRQAASLREQLGELAQALDQANQDVKAKEGKIAELGQQLNLALASRVGKLERYRSEFFGRLREALGNRADLRVVGDRFVVPTDILFGSGSADLDEAAQTGLAQLAATLRQLSGQIPGDIDWVLRIDGHTDHAPIHNERFPSNWELSTARAVAIVKYLAEQGIPAERLAANGFGEFQPLDPGLSLAAYARNRRIELQLTNR